MSAKKKPENKLLSTPIVHPQSSTHNRDRETKLLVIEAMFGEKRPDGYQITQWEVRMFARPLKDFEMEGLVLLIPGTNHEFGTLGDGTVTIRGVVNGFYIHNVTTRTDMRDYKI